MKRVLGLGVDICHTPRVVRLLQKYGDRFLRRAFAPSEIQHVAELQSMGKDAEVQLANYISSRWAVKEAFYKSVRGTWRVAFPEVEAIGTTIPAS